MEGVPQTHVRFPICFDNGFFWHNNLDVCYDLFVGYPVIPTQ